MTHAGVIMKIIIFDEKSPGKSPGDPDASELKRTERHDAAETWLIINLITFPRKMNIRPGQVIRL